ncbi:hypothetical protein ACT3CD_04650 [Geofilum sp. OHC36d9]|uniref:hypothetical protein n=1 Tax=Geofilum sp. OHC36d9 TaxID=3458413 RepID=UPI004034D203
MLKKITVLLIGLLLVNVTGCQQEKSNSIILTNNAYFHPVEENLIYPIEENTLNTFKTLFPNPDNTIILYKHFNNEDYNLFIALPYKTSFSQLTNFKTHHAGSKAIISDESTYYRKSKNDSIFMAEALIKINEEKFVYFSAYAQNEEKLDTLFTPSQLRKKITKQ